MKKLYLLIWINLFFITFYGQNFEWAKREGLWAYDYGYGITTDKSGNVYVAGKYEKNAKFSGVTLPCQGNHDIYLVKYTSSGALTWIRTAGGNTGDYAHAIACDGSNYVYIAGEIQGTNNTIKFIGSSVTITCKGSNDIFLAKYDLNGNVLWAKRAGDSYNDKGLSIAYDNAGNIYICGFFTTKATFGTIVLTGYGDEDIFLAKYDANGNCLWAKKAGSSGLDEAKSIKCDAAGNVYVCGMYSNGANFNGQIVSSSSGKYNTFLAKYSTTGTLLWVKTAGGNFNDVAWSLTLDNAGKIYMTGEFNGSAKFGDVSLSTYGSADIFVTSYNSDGNVQWAKKAGGKLVDRARGIGTDGNNIYITGQFGKQATFGSFTKTAVDSSDIFIACLNNSGQFLWVSTVGGPGDKYEDLGYESGNAICAETSGNVYTTGALLDGGVFGSIALSPYTRTDVFVTKVKKAASGKKDDEDSLGIGLLSFNAEAKEKNVNLTWAIANKINKGYFTIERSKDTIDFETIGTIQTTDSSDILDYSFTDESLQQGIENEIYYRLKKTDSSGKFSYSPTIAVVLNKWSNAPINIYPNPTKNAFVVSLNSEFKDQPFLLFIYDISGKEINKLQITNEKTDIDMSPFGSGIYFIEVKTEDELIFKEKLIVQQ